MGFKEPQLIDFNAIVDFDVLRKKRYTYRPVTDADFISDPVMFKWSPDGTQFAAINRHDLIIYNDQLEETFRETFDLRHGPRNIEWSPAGEKIAIGFYQGIVYIYDVVNRSVERQLPTIDIEDINQMVWSSETGELIIPSNRYINIFNNEGYIIRKLDFKQKTAFDKTACRPGTHEFALAFPTSEGDHLYIIDRNKGIRECVVQEIQFANDTANLLKYETEDLLITQSNAGIKFWRAIVDNG
jgi:WD40 repeat protein